MNTTDFIKHIEEAERNISAAAGCVRAPGTEAAHEAIVDALRELARAVRALS